MDEYEFLHGQRQYTIQEGEPGVHSLKIASVTKGLGGRLAIVAENDVGRAVSSCHLKVFGEYYCPLISSFLLRTYSIIYSLKSTLVKFRKTKKPQGPIKSHLLQTAYRLDPNLP